LIKAEYISPDLRGSKLPWPRSLSAPDQHSDTRLKSRTAAESNVNTSVKSATIAHVHDAHALNAGVEIGPKALVTVCSKVDGPKPRRTKNGDREPDGTQIRDYSTTHQIVYRTGEKCYSFYHVAMHAFPSEIVQQQEALRAITEGIVIVSKSLKEEILGQ
jgi:hypothetical protein